MELHVREQEGLRVLFVQGDVGRGAHDALVDRVGTLLSGPGDRLVIDLSQVTYLSSHGLNALVRVTAQANVQQQRIVYADPAPIVEGILRTTQLDRFFEVHPSVAAALAALR